jgi:hypothetical protein
LYQLVDARDIQTEPAQLLYERDGLSTGDDRVHEVVITNIDDTGGSLAIDCVAYTPWGSFDP